MRTVMMLAGMLGVAACDGAPPLSAQRPAQQVRELVARADSLEQAQAFREAADVWRDAADAAPRLRSWFLLAAAAAHPDRLVRQRWLATVRPDAITDAATLARRTVGSDLRARLRHGDTTGAVAIYLSLGNLRDSVVGHSFRERTGHPFTADERLRFARQAQRSGDGTLARRQYALAAASLPGGLPAADRFAYAQLLLDGGQTTAAVREFAKVDATYAGRAAYQRARALLRQRRVSEAAAALRAITTTYAADTNAAGFAWYLLGDLAADAARDRDARAYWRTMASRYPTHPFANTAAFRAAVIAAAGGAWDSAATEWRAVAARAGADNDERWAARYWLGRALAAQGDVAGARAQWQALLRDEPRSYYALLAARRLDTAPWSPSGTGTRATATERGRLTALQISEALAAAALLDSLALRSQARDLREDIIRAASGHAADARLAAELFAQQELASPAIRLAARADALDGLRTAADHRLLYPLPYRELLAQHGARHGVTVPFAAALIRQESRFTPAARSAADARGLMQVMPAVGKSIARGAGITRWHDTLLYVPAVNVSIGMRHLADALRRDGSAHPAYALAAYNAGRSRMVRWRSKRGAAADWELFVERIPYVETRDYVRIVLRNEEWYRVLYGDAALSQEL